MKNFLLFTMATLGALGTETLNIAAEKVMSVEAQRTELLKTTIPAAMSKIAQGDQESSAKLLTRISEFIDEAYTRVNKKYTKKWPDKIPTLDTIKAYYTIAADSVDALGRIRESARTSQSIALAKKQFESLKERLSSSKKTIQEKLDEAWKPGRPKEVRMSLEVLNSLTQGTLDAIPYAQQDAKAKVEEQTSRFKKELVSAREKLTRVEQKPDSRLADNIRQQEKERIEREKKAAAQREQELRREQAQQQLAQERLEEERRIAKQAKQQKLAQEQLKEKELFAEQQKAAMQETDKLLLSEKTTKKLLSDLFSLHSQAQERKTGYLRGSGENYEARKNTAVAKFIDQLIQTTDTNFFRSIAHNPNILTLMSEREADKPLREVADSLFGRIWRTGPYFGWLVGSHNLHTTDLESAKKYQQLIDIIPLEKRIEATLRVLLMLSILADSLFVKEYYPKYAAQLKLLDRIPLTIDQIDALVKPYKK